MLVCIYGYGHICVYAYVYTDHFHIPLIKKPKLLLGGYFNSLSQNTITTLAQWKL